ncbi:MAG: SIMPL domain-containing protein, partial [Armatimonadota bacterium]
QAPTAREAAEANAKTASAVSDAVKRMGVPASHIQTAWYDVSPVYAREEPVPRGEGPVTPRIVGYRVSNVVSVRLEGNLGRVGEVIDTALNAGANRVDGLSWDVRDRSKPLQTAIRRAVRDAQLKAQTIASALKVRLGPPTIVSEQGAAPILEQRVFDRAAGFAAATPISPGTIQITANVVIQFSFR